MEADVDNLEIGDRLWDASGEAGRQLYKKGDAKEAGAAGLDVYLLKNVSTAMTFGNSNEFVPRIGVHNGTLCQLYRVFVCCVFKKHPVCSIATDTVTTLYKLGVCT